MTGPAHPALAGSAELRWAGERLVALPDAALWWPGEGTLFVADLHLGKGDVFRAAGIPIPSGTTRDDLSRLSGLMDATGIRRLVILGDFFHGAASQSDGVHHGLAAWRDAHPDAEVLLVRGNHDRHAGDPPAALGMTVETGPVALGPFHLRHEPSQEGSGPSAGFELAGHLHPAVRLEGPGRDRVTLPCFWFGARRCVLPAFGAFTGTARIRPGAGDRILVVADGAVLEVEVASSGNGPGDGRSNNRAGPPP